MKNNLTTLKAAMACALLAVAPAFVACSDDGEGGGGDTGTRSALTVSVAEGGGLSAPEEGTDRARAAALSEAVFGAMRKKGTELYGEDVKAPEPQVQDNRKKKKA